MKKHSLIKSKSCHKVVAFLMMLIMLMGVLGVTASAAPIQQPAYDTYTYWTAPGTRWSVSSTPMYEYKETISGPSLGIGEFKNPADIFVDGKGLIYILDSDNSRVAVANPDFTLNTVIKDLTHNGEVMNFAGAKGLFVTNDGRIFIADTSNARVLVVNLQGNVLDILTLPEDDVIPETFIYAPTRIAVDSNNSVFILSQGSYYGALLYKALSNGDYEFTGFYGANSVTGTILDIFDRIYEMLFVSDTQMEGREKELPYSFTDIAMDEFDFVYTATGATSTYSSATGQLKKLSPGGTNILKNKTKKNVYSAEGTDFADGGGIHYPDKRGSMEWRVTDMGTLDVDKYGFMYGFCGNYGHVFIYDQECNLLTVFGAAINGGVQKGTVSSGDAIHVNDINQDVLVLDSKAQNVVVYSETDYGSLVKQAQKRTNDGSYVEAKPLWEKALSYDRNQQLAYRGLARAALIEEEYETTLKYAKLGFDQDTYAQAFTYVRNDYLTDNFLWIFGIAILLVGGLIFFLIYSNKKELKLIKNKKISTLFECVFHPFQGAQQIRYYNNGSTLIATILLVLYTLSSIISGIYTGFMYVILNKSSFNAFFYVLRGAGLVLLWTVVNWAMSTLFEGKGKMKHVYITTCYALLPLIVSNVLCTILSNVMTPEESLIISAISVVCLALAGIMLCVGVMTAHDYGFFKFLVMTLVVVFGMLIAIFVILMMYVLIQQAVSFVSSIYKEVSYR